MDDRIESKKRQLDELLNEWYPAKAAEGLKAEYAPKPPPVEEPAVVEAAPAEGASDEDVEAVLASMSPEQIQSILGE